MRSDRARPSMQDPAIYRIVVGGRVNPTHAALLEAMNITVVDRNEGDQDSILVGRLLDQAALAGVLNTLFEMHCPVLSVDCLEDR